MINQPTPTSRVINRHMARCLTELEDNGYSAECIEIVKRAFCWAREDLGKAERPIGICRPINNNQEEYLAFRKFLDDKCNGI